MAPRNRGVGCVWTPPPRRSKGGKEGPAIVPEQGRRKPVDRGRARRRLDRAHAAETPASRATARSTCCGPGSTRGHGARGGKPWLEGDRNALGVHRSSPAQRSRRENERLGPQPDRPVHPAAARGARPGPFSRSRSSDAPAARFARPHGAAAEPGGDGRVPARTSVQTPTSARSIACWPRPIIGERWGRLWLDQARYADSNGFNIDAPRSIWKYRDWVIAALNRGHALRPVRHRPGRRRPETRCLVRRQDRHRLSPQYADQPGRGHRRRAVPRSNRSSTESTRPVRSSWA